MLEYNEKGLFLSSDATPQHIMEAFSVAARLDPAEPPVALAPDGYEPASGADRSGSYEGVAARYRNEAGTIAVRLTLRAYSDVVLGFVAAETVNDNDFGKQRTFAADNGIELTFRPAEPIQGLMANYRHKDWWTRPFFGTEPAALPARTQSVLWRTASGYRHLLPVTGPVYRTDAAGSAGGFTLRLSSHQGGHTRCETLAFALAAGHDPYRLVRDNVDRSLKALDYPTLPRERKTYPAVLDELGWCSWDAFYHKVNEEGLLTKADELRRLGLPVGWVMIDDGWSDIRDGKLAAFEADKEKFPQGLAHTVAVLKEQYGIKRVGVWHTVVGYWGGIHPESDIAKKQRDSLFRVPRGNLVPYPEAGRGFGFWHAWHSFLRRQGVDFVKVDSQSAVLNYMKDQRSIGEAAAAAHEALEASVALHFNGTIINCMGMAAENVWHRPQSAVSWNSDDFVPQEKRGFPEHALQNAYNSFYHGAFYWGDWDMYWTKNHDDVQSAVLRAVSGGPIYFSDAPGNTDPANVWPLIYRDGKIIRCDAPPSPTADCLLQDPTEAGIPLKLWNTAGRAGVVAAFHIGKAAEAVEGTVGPRDIPGLRGTEFAVYEHFSRKCGIIGLEGGVPFRLEEGGYALYTVVPLTGAASPIGLTDKYVPSHAVGSVRQQEKRTVIGLREGGVFAFVCGMEPVRVLCNGQAIQYCLADAGSHLYEADCRGCAGAATIEIVLP